jgi:hypothetical protein
MRGVITALATIASIALMAGSAQAVSPDVQNANETASRLPTAASPAAAEANQAALAPSVKATVAEGGERELLETTTSPDVRFDLLRYGKVTVTSTQSPPSRFTKPASAPIGVAARHVKAHAAGYPGEHCYGSPWTKRNYNTAAGTISWVFSRENGWCGEQGYQNRITWLGGPTFASWSQWPYCQTNQRSDYSWDGWPTWVHMGNWGTVGISYAWGCAGFSTIHAVVRINAGGYYDFYDDYGF